MCVYICIYICICVCVCVCVFAQKRGEYKHIYICNGLVFLRQPRSIFLYILLNLTDNCMHLIFQHELWPKLISQLNFLSHYVLIIFKRAPKFFLIFMKAFVSVKSS